MRHLRKITGFVLLVSMLASLTACGGEPAATPTMTTASSGPNAIGFADGESDELARKRAALNYALGSTPMAYPTPATDGYPGAAEGSRADGAWSSKDPYLNVGRVAPPNYQSPLTAGQVDDNAKFDEYLDFLRNKNPYLEVRPINVEQRLFVRVLDSAQQP